MYSLELGMLQKSLSKFKNGWKICPTPTSDSITTEPSHAGAGEASWSITTLSITVTVLPFFRFRLVSLTFIDVGAT